MSVPAPHFLLFATARNDRPPHEPAAGRWRFVLEAVDGSATLEAADAEPEVSRDRLELLAIVRGLEALDQPSTVTVVTSSRYINRGLRYGLPVWRENGWQWERFGQFVPIKNADLWRRIDHAMRFHGVKCRFVDSPGVGIAQVTTHTNVKASAVEPEPSPGRTEQRPRRKSLWNRICQTLDHSTRSLTALGSRPQWGRMSTC